MSRESCWCFLYLVQERHFTLLEGGWLAAAPPICQAARPFLLYLKGPDWCTQSDPVWLSLVTVFASQNASSSDSATQG